MVEHVRKPFSTEDYKHNNLAFDLLVRDLKATPGRSGNYYYPVLKNEDYGIDVVVYFSEEEYRKGKYPVAYIELEMKEKSACVWEKGKYPFDDIHFLYRKEHLLHQNAVPFWVCYNYDGTDCVTVQMEDLQCYPIGQNSSGVEDLVIPLPIALCKFGVGNIVNTIEDFVSGQFPPIQGADMRTLFDYENEAFRKRIHYTYTVFAQAALTHNQRTNTPITGIKHFI